MKITVFTPTYNRAYILGNLYRSLQRQSFRDFEWLIIDDGSSDNTEELAVQWQNEGNDFPIRYNKVPNGGKCRAINRALSLAEGKLFLVIDSDDILTPDALEKIDQWERKLPIGEKYCGVSGNLGLSSEETPNHIFPEDHLDGTLFDRYGAADGERAFAFYTEVHRHYLYPTFIDETFMTEAVTYNRMAHDGYKMRFYNDIVCIYEYRDDGLTRAGNELFLRNPKGYGLWLREKTEYLGGGWKDRIRLWYSFCCEMTACDEPYRLTNKQIAEYIGAPGLAIYALSLVHKFKTLIKRK